MGASFVDHLPLAETAAHIHGATTDRALCLGVVERPLYLSHCAECSWTQRGKGACLTKLTQIVTGRCTFSIWCSGLPAQAASLG